jgi:hypothetical protein
MILNDYSNLLRDFILNDLSTTFLQLSAWFLQPMVLRLGLSQGWFGSHRAGGCWLLGGCCRKCIEKPLKDHQRIIKASSTKLFEFELNFFCPALHGLLEIRIGDAAGPAILAQLWGACHRQ